MNSGHIPYLDGWRGIAIILVLINHFGQLPRIGVTGVHFFFVLSGLLMARILFVERPSLTTFYKRRIARIFPVYYLYLAVIAVAGWCLSPAFQFSDIFYSAIFVRTYYPLETIWSETIPIGHLWSLSVEEHCYVILSVFVLLFGSRIERFAKWSTLGAALLCVVCFKYYRSYPPLSESAFFMRTECAGFCIFISSAMFLWFRQWQVTFPAWVSVACALVGITLGALYDQGLLKYVVSPFFISLSLNSLAYAPAPVLKALSHPVLRWFGVCSFSIYLWQQPLYFLTMFGYFPFGYFFALCVALCIASVSYYFYEVPMRRMIRNL